MNKELLNTMYEYFLTNDIITTKELKNLGINSNNITSLVKKSVLRSIKRGEYTLDNVEGLYEYSKTLSNNKEIDKAILGFNMCYKINPNHEETCFWLLTKCILEEKYDECFKYFDTLINTKDELYRKDYLYILYMLSYFTNIPDKYIDILKEIEFQTVKVKDERVGDTHSVNCIRYNSMYNKSLKAKRFLTDKKNNQGYYTMMDFLYKILIKRARDYEITRTNLINEYIKKEDYDSVIKLLQSDRKYKAVGELNIISYLCNILKDIKTGNLPVTSNYVTPNCIEAILHNNFELALELSFDYCRKNDVTSEDNLIYVLIQRINSFINVKEDDIDISKIQYSKNIITNIKLLRKNGGISLLNAMTKKQRNLYLKKLNTEEDISASEIGLSEPKRILLIYAPNKHNYEDFNKLFHEANELYESNNITIALKKFKQILETGKPSVKVLSKLGLCYLKTNKINGAIKYLEVATLLSKELGLNYDFTELICRLRNEEVKEDDEVKYTTLVSQDEFNYDINSFYGIDNIEEIIDYISTGSPVNSIKDKFNLTLEQVNIFKLILAREYYINGDFEYGDYYLKQVEREKDKTNAVKTFFSRLKDDKKFLMHRDLTNHKKLVLKLIKG